MKTTHTLSALFGADKKACSITWIDSIPSRQDIREWLDEKAAIYGLLVSAEIITTTITPIL